MTHDAKVAVSLIVWVLFMILGFLVGGFWGLGIVVAIPVILWVLL